ncbi:hypothetical protein MRB53_008882 [Persea americana]|uniref:Uncharacterized protein n=1 Tax=Persea americana TaxID=3435 RepID=A0ACC2LMK4_PERAE|nr:hypothetical protein MRB53_008882 [Persea americana]
MKVAKLPEQRHPSTSTASTSCFRLSLLTFATLVFISSTLNGIHLQNMLKIGRSANLTALIDDSGASPSPNFLLFIGILTLPDQYWRRNMLRLVYGIQSPVNVQVDMKFIFCNLTKEDQKVLVALEIMRYDDIIILNCTENMDNGKTYTYLSSLPGLLDKKYDYVMKADDDTYLRLDNLVESLLPLPREDMYYGFIAPCLEMNPYRYYMSGMGYILSWDLVEWIKTSEIARNHTHGPEDRVVGEWLELGKRGKNRYNNKPAMYNFPLNVAKDRCSHEFIPDTIAVHKLKDQGKWIKTLEYFNVSKQLKPSKFYHIP